MSNFAKCLEFVMKWETGGDMSNGGYTNDPHDPGGETKWGISKRAHPNLDIANLTYDEAAMVYFNKYWSPAGCADMEAAHALAVFNLGVMMGLDDVQAVSQFTGWRSVALYQMEKHVRVCRNNPDMKRYLFGWARRWEDLCKTCRKLEENGNV